MASINTRAVAADGSIAIGGTQATDPETGTLMFWSSMIAWGIANNRAIFEQRDVGTGAGYCRIGGDTGGTTARLGVMINYATKDSIAFMDTSLLTTNTWYFFAFTLDAQVTAPRIFIGDLTTTVVEVSYASTPAARATGSGARVSDGGANAYLCQSAYQQAIDLRGNWPGRIAYAAWYDTVLTDAQIIASRFMPWGWIPGARGIWHPGRHKLTAVPDMSGNGRNGTPGAGCTMDAGLPVGYLCGRS